MIGLHSTLLCLNTPDGRKQRKLSDLLDRIEQTRLRLYKTAEKSERLLISQKLDTLLNRYYRLCSRR
ncbi:aspartyl-phosphate phosphatase Spo0E family protein [Desulfotomaculum copahuensis]|uniref:Sporulation protein Spo0E n=1 Tax=Desulfotomaculum copahuensis TaxID=1838280 RepID=A0A1B7LIN3_9FIRM|nr:aspartyl-phosphate phosphatase Spo0E family protein [Desulfotomaculum copahuensis]OAT86424.1 hypothetical protein A6M21_03075 [Desulfotomaculum copahuensis]